ncbi:hypothetical protein [Natrinema longum]|uniref:PH domain-containing protein n=1 Tax=Natrinema longum TaxID=370324 RepID=A0A8A2UCZ3_9EURY|nr:hypothetical protein [Natrinema longum]MBZ6495689.1 hypothetical protein [Natrinema longum]QSW86352.1 hypothetical protein J0X27_05905 [Natrinema longum]
MTDRDSSRSLEGGEVPTASSDAVFRLVFGGYVGVLLAGIVASVLALTDRPSIVGLGAAVTALLSGWLVAIAFAGRVDGLAVWLGRTRARRSAIVLPAGPFGMATTASLVTAFPSRFTIVTLGAGIVVAIVGAVLGWMAQSRAVNAMTEDEPGATWRWKPPSSPKLDAVLLATWLLLGATAAASGNWAESVLWTGLAAFWVCSSLVEGRWRVGSVGETPAIRVHDAGLVKQRPYTRSIVSWRDVSHVRVREDELVLDRGLFDVRFDRDELADLEAVRAEIEHHLPDGVPSAVAE